MTSSTWRNIHVDGKKKCVWIISCSCNGKCSRSSERGSCLCKAAKLFRTPLCTCKVTGSKVCTNCGDVEVEEDGLTAAERDLVGPVPTKSLSLI